MNYQDVGDHGRNLVIDSFVNIGPHVMSTIAKVVPFISRDFYSQDMEILPCLPTKESLEKKYWGSRVLLPFALRSQIPLKYHSTNSNPKWRPLARNLKRNFPFVFLSKMFCLNPNPSFISRSLDYFSNIQDIQYHLCSTIYPDLCTFDRLWIPST